MAITWKSGEKEGKVEYEGRVLTDIQETYLGHDRYHYSVLVIDKEGQLKNIGVGSGYCDQTSISADVEKDANQEAIKAYADYKKKENERRIKEAEEKERETVRKGKFVKVFKGRKVPVGTIGKVFWMGVCKFSGKSRLGMKDKMDTVHWILTEHVKVVD